MDITNRKDHLMDIANRKDHLMDIAKCNVHIYHKSPWDVKTTCYWNKVGRSKLCSHIRGDYCLRTRFWPANLFFVSELFLHPCQLLTYITLDVRTTRLQEQDWLCSNIKGDYCLGTQFWPANIVLISRVIYVKSWYGCKNNSLIGTRLADKSVLIYSNPLFYENTVLTGQSCSL